MPIPKTPTIKTKQKKKIPAPIKVKLRIHKSYVRPINKLPKSRSEIGIVSPYSWKENIEIRLNRLLKNRHPVICVSNLTILNSCRHGFVRRAVYVDSKFFFRPYGYKRKTLGHSRHSKSTALPRPTESRHVF